MTDSPALALVTGASRGIGASCAVLLAKAGFEVCLNYNSNELAARKVLEAIEAKAGKAWLVRADVSLEAGVDSLFESIDARPGELKALVNNAGILQNQSTLADMDYARIESVFRLNAVGALYVAAQAVKRMSERYGGTGGAIVNVSSAASRLGSPNEYVDYASTKGAIDTMTLGLAKEEGPFGIRTNAVRPGLIETDIHASGGMPDRVARLSPGVPMQRGGSAEEVAQTIAWLISDEASYVNGALIDVSGGR